MLEAAVRAVTSRGYAATTARSIAAEGGFNSPLIFYHYGGVDQLLLAALGVASKRRLQRFRTYVGDERDAAALVEKLKTLWECERESPEIKIVQELVATPAFARGRERDIATLMQAWFDYAEEVIARVIEGTVIVDFISPRNAAFALVALLLGLEKIETIAPDGGHMQSLFASAELAMPLLGRVLRPHGGRPNKPIKRVRVE